jgi:hypothetical protein
MPNHPLHNVPSNPRAMRNPAIEVEAIGTRNRALHERHGYQG